MKDVSRRRLGRLTRAVLAAFCLLPSVGLAQLTNDEVPRDRTVPIRTQIEDDLKSSRFQLGPVRLYPQLSFVGPTYDNNVLAASGSEPRVTDWTFTVSAGLGVLIPLGKKVYLGGSILPQYIWYDRLQERRQWGGTYGGSLYGFFNRLSLEADYKTQLTPQYPNSEIQTQVLGDTRGGDLKLEVDLGGPWSVYANGEYQQLEYRPLGAPPPIIDGVLNLLNRNEGAVRGGLRYKITSYFYVGVGGEGTRTTFPVDPTRGDNTSTAAILSVHYDRPRFFVNFSGGYRMGRPLDDSGFPEFSTFTGSGFASYELIPNLDLRIYGQRGIEYGLYFNNAYYFGSEEGGGLLYHLGKRLTINAYGGYGTNTYPVAVDGVQRIDNVTAYGGGASFVVYRNIAISAQASDQIYNSNVSAFDRKVFRFTAGLVIGLVAP